MPLSMQASSHVDLAMGEPGGRASWQKYILPAIFGVLLLGAIPLMVTMLMERGYITAPGQVTVQHPVLMAFKFLADMSIGASYVVIGALLLRFTRRTGLHIPLLAVLPVTGFFIIGCAATRFIVAMTTTVDATWLAIVVQYTVAFVSTGSALMLIPLLPNITDMVKNARETHAARDIIQQQNDGLRRANAEANENLERLRALIDCMPIGAIAMDARHVVLHANDRFCRLFDVQVLASSLVGKNYLRVADMKRSIVMDEKQLWQLDYSLSPDSEAQQQLIHLKDGRVISRDAVPLTVEGEYKGHLLLYRDATREHRASRAKSEFMSLASHQLRTPLTILKWSYGRLARGLDTQRDEMQLKILHEARSATERMGHTIDTMLAIARVEAGSVRAENLEMKLGKTLNDLRTDLRHAYEAKHQTMTIDCPPNVVISTDPFMFREVIQNLLTNAIKYTPTDGTIAIRAWRDGGTVQIEVEDSGYGIPAHQQNRIFQKFFRADNVVQNDTEGTGLGLYLVHLLTKMLHGSISFASTEGKGTTFTLLFPVSQAYVAHTSR